MFCVLIARSSSRAARLATDEIGREVGREVRKVGRLGSLVTSRGA